MVGRSCDQRLQLAINTQPAHMHTQHCIPALPPKCVDILRLTKRKVLPHSSYLMKLPCYRYRMPCTGTACPVVPLMSLASLRVPNGILTLEMQYRYLQAPYRHDMNNVRFSRLELRLGEWTHLSSCLLACLLACPRPFCELGTVIHK